MAATYVEKSAQCIPQYFIITMDRYFFLFDLNKSNTISHDTVTDCQNLERNAATGFTQDTERGT
jgi:hypothetical protein